MSYQLIETSPPKSKYGSPFYVYRCYFCKALAVTRESYEKPPAKCGKCKR